MDRREVLRRDFLTRKQYAESLKYIFTFWTPGMKKQLRTALSKVQIALRIAVAALAITAFCYSASATTITIDFGEPGKIQPNPQGVFIFPFSDLTGTQLQGQLMSLDFQFANNEFPNNAFLRLFKSSSHDFQVSTDLILSQFLPHEILGSPADSFAVGANAVHLKDSFVSGPATGQLIDDHGLLTGTPQILPSIGMGITPLESDSSGTPNGHAPVDIYGLHFGFTAPDAPGVEIVGGYFFIFDRRKPFGVGPSLPESGATVGLLSFALVVLYGVRSMKIVKPAT